MSLIKLVSPNGGETLKAGEIKTIEWSLWSPEQIPNKLFWVEADQTSIVTDVNGNLTRLKDKSGNGRDFSQIQGTPLLTNHNSVYRSVELRTDADQLYIPHNGFTLSPPYTIYFLFREFQKMSAAILFQTAYFSSPFFQSVGASNSYTMLAGGSLSSTDTAPVNEYSLIKVCVNGANSYIQRNNNTPTTGNLNSQMYGFKIGSDQSPKPRLGFLFAMATSGVPTEADDINLKLYANKKFGVLI